VSVLEALGVVGQVITPLALVAGGYVAGYMFGSLDGVTAALFTRKGKK
jgi:hypothetical protein